jgi:hypothetical protein
MNVLRPLLDDLFKNVKSFVSTLDAPPIISKFHFQNMRDGVFFDFQLVGPNNFQTWTMKYTYLGMAIVQK